MVGALYLPAAQGPSGPRAWQMGPLLPRIFAHRIHVRGGPLGPHYLGQGALRAPKPEGFCHSILLLLGPWGGAQETYDGGYNTPLFAPLGPTFGVVIAHALRLLLGPSLPINRMGITLFWASFFESFFNLF